MNNRLDFKSIKREVNLKSVFRHYGVELRESGKNQYRGRCPIHRGDGSEAFHANLARNIFHCFACGVGGTALDFVAAMERCSLYEAAQKLRTMTNSLDQSRLSPHGKELVTKRRKVSLPLTFTLRGVDCAHSYLADRGISKRDGARVWGGLLHRAGANVRAAGHSYPQRRRRADRLLRSLSGSDSATIPSPAGIREVGGPI